ncbi:MAG: hypothetical protein ABI647_23045 [Gemmatimonadota bacterium]
MKRTAVRAVLGVGLLYLVVGVGFGALAGRAGSSEVRVAWRWAAWVVSGIAFEAHIRYEQVRLGSTPRVTALHVASAAGLGAFGLGALANVHAQAVSPERHSLMLALSLVIWPLMTMVPAFVVALVVATLFARARRSV